MNQENLKLIVRNLELLVESLKKEVHSESNSYNYDEIAPYIGDYDEIFEDDED